MGWKFCKDINIGLLNENPIAYRTHQREWEGGKYGRSMVYLLSKGEKAEGRKGEQGRVRDVNERVSERNTTR